MLKKFLEVGKIVSTHGLRGDVRVQPWCNGPEFLCGVQCLYLKGGSEKITILSAKPHKNIVIMHINGIDCVEAAKALVGEVLFVDRCDVDLPEGEYFIQDIIGLSVYDKLTGAYYGKVTDIFETGANSVYCETDDQGKDYLAPAIGDVVREVDVAGGRIAICPIEGIFDNDEN